MELFYKLSQLLQTPTVWVINGLFLYALFETGRLAAQWALRLKNRSRANEHIQAKADSAIGGYPVLSYWARSQSVTVNEVEIYAFRQIELIRLVTRVAPMLGLVATLIPMGPALVSMANSDFVEMSELLRTAFTAVVLALVAASFTYWIASVKKRWLAEEIVALEKHVFNTSAVTQ